MLRIIGLVFLGLLLFWNLLRIVLLIVGLSAGAGAGASTGYVGSYFLGAIGMTALIAFLFLRLLQKTD